MTTHTRPAPGRPLPGSARPPLLREVYGRLIRRLRQRQGRTLADVALDAGVSIAYLSEIERGLKEPSSEVLAAVCDALGSSVTGLVGAAHRELRDETSAAPGRLLDLTTRLRRDLAGSDGALPSREQPVAPEPPETGTTFAVVTGATLAVVA